MRLVIKYSLCAHIDGRGQLWGASQEGFETVVNTDGISLKLFGQVVIFDSRGKGECRS